MGKIVYDLTGQRFGRLTVIQETDHRNQTNCKMWECRCECGSLHLVSAWNLRSGKTKSCGCLQREHFSGEIKSAKKPEFPPKEDCFAFQSDHCDCLTEMLCVTKGKCKFYKKGESNG